AAATKGLTMLARGTAYEFHPWTMLVADCEIVEVPVESDFLATWLKVSAKFGPDVRESAVARGKEQPHPRRKELETRLAPISPLYRLFCDSCMYLQTAIGPDMPMTLPQSQLGKLMGTTQKTISTFCQNAEDAGLLTRVNPHYSRAKRIAVLWRCN